MSIPTVVNPFLASMAAIASVLLFSSAASARTPRIAQVPNAAGFSCSLCHTDATGDSPRNAFGIDSDDALDIAGEDGVIDWSVLAALDSDGDGFTNGAELLDPDGTWVMGDDNPAGNASDPSDGTDVPAEPTSTDAGPGAGGGGGCSSQAVPTSNVPWHIFAGLGVLSCWVRRRRA